MIYAREPHFLSEEKNHLETLLFQMEGEFLKQTSVYRERRGKYYFQTSFLIFLNFSHVAGV